jgi:hypothetical protein
MTLRRARSVDAYAEWVRQAVPEEDDLRDCLECVIEDLSELGALLDPLEEGIKAVFESMNSGTYCFGREDLPFTHLASRDSGEIPCHTLLKQINETLRRGLDLEADYA